MDVPLGSVIALIFYRSGYGSLVVCFIDLIVVSFEVFCVLVGCIAFSGIKRFSVCRGGVNSGGCYCPVGKIAIRLSGSGREFDVNVNGNRGGGIVCYYFVMVSATMSFVMFICCSKFCIDLLFLDGCS